MENRRFWILRILTLCLLLSSPFFSVLPALTHCKMGTFYGVLYFHEKGWIDVKDLKISCIRLSISWGEVEPVKGKFLSSASPLKKMDKCLQLGIEVIPVIRSSGAGWAVKSFKSSASSPPKDLQKSYHPVYAYSKSYYEFIKKIAEKYRGKLSLVVIENEVTAKKFWEGTMDEYLRLLATARKAFQDVDPHIKIADSGIASFAWGVYMVYDLFKKGKSKEAFSFYKEYFHEAYFPTASSPEDLYKFLRKKNVREQIEKVEYLLNHLKKYVDVINFHFYESPHLLPYLVAFIKKKIGDLPLICNEMGVRYRLNTFKRDEKSAEDIIKKLTISKALGLSAVIWFPFQNDQHNIVGLGNKEKGVNLITFIAFKTALKFLNQPCLHCKNCSERNFTCYSFIFPDSKVEVMWSNEEVVMEFPKEALIYNFHGNEVKKRRVVIYKSPILIVFPK